MEKQSPGNKQFKKIRTAHIALMKHTRAVKKCKRHIERLIKTFPKQDKPLFEEQITKLWEHYHENAN